VGVYPIRAIASLKAIENYAAVTMMLSSLSHKSANGNTDAVLYYPGLFDTNMRGSLQNWADDMPAIDKMYRYVLVAGTHPESGQHEHLAVSVLCEVFGVMDGNYSQVHAKHTGSQAEWFVRMAQELDLEVVALFAPAFHLPRAYLTTVKALCKAGIEHQVLLLPRALPMSPVAVLRMLPPFEDGVYTQMALVRGEAHKILAYTDDVATLGELEQYLGLHL
jgi:hypothetical protein